MEENAKKLVKKNTLWYSERLREEVRNWPAEVKEEMGGQLNKVEYGGEAIYVLHVITKKKSQKTAQSDIDTAKKRYNELVERRKKLKYE